MHVMKLTRTSDVDAEADVTHDMELSWVVKNPAGSAQSAEPAELTEAMQTVNVKRERMREPVQSSPVWWSATWRTWRSERCQMTD